MTKHELLVKLREHNSALTQKQIGEVLEQTFVTITQAVKQDGQFRWPGFGTFQRRVRAARQGRNPQTGKTIQIGETTTMTLKPSLSVKQALAQPVTKARGKARAEGRG